MTERPLAGSRVRDLRPLDPFRSIKIKLGVLVGATTTISAVAVWAGLHNDLATRYTLPLSVVIALGVTQLLARGMTSPLREMTAAAQAMARGDYSRRVHATSNDEVGELARAFNRMAEDLGDADRQRRELVANVSHELRTPVSALRAVLENLVDGVTTPDDASLRTALAQTERLGDLVSQLLDLSRVEAGAVPLHCDRFALQSFLAACVEQAELAGRDVRYVVDVEPADLTLVADQDRLHQVVANLLDNAARHSPQGRRGRRARPRRRRARAARRHRRGPGHRPAGPPARVRALPPRGRLGPRRRHRPGPGHRPLGRRPAPRLDPRRGVGDGLRHPRHRAAGPRLLTSRDRCCLGTGLTLTPGEVER